MDLQQCERIGCYIDMSVAFLVSEKSRDQEAVVVDNQTSSKQMGSAKGNGGPGNYVVFTDVH